MQNEPYEAHPAADRMPAMDDERLAELANDIRANGLRNEIVLYEGMILDGRNRQRACQIAGVPPRYTSLDSDADPYAFVWSQNGERRDLDPLQREVIRRLLGSDSMRWQSANAKRSAKTRTQPRENGLLASRYTPDGADLIAKSSNSESGTSVRAAALIAADRDLAEQVARGEIKGMEALRQIKRAQLATRVAALPTGQHRVIYADPPWRYSDNRAGIDRADSAAESHYPTMPVSDLCTLDVKSIAAPDAVLFCWATFPLVDDALKVVTAWGFTYKTAFVWDKQRSNVGNYHDARAELLLVCTRGSCLPEIDTRPKQVQTIARTRHSEKPDFFRELIDEMYPSGPRIELFCRGDAPDGWTVWGNEAELAS